ncbi:MAG TPA: hypothetical protein VMD51_11045 [Mycobacterium sp.]|nr:hypothetical protein [Mycobacterium sp.]
MPEQGGDHVHGGVVVEVLGGEHAAAIVRGQPQRGAVGVAGAGGDRQLLEALPDRLGRHRTGVPGALQKVGRSRQRCLGGVVAPVAGRHGVDVVEGLDVANDLGDHPAQAVTDRDDPGAIVFRRFDVQQVVDPTVG